MSITPAEFVPYINGALDGMVQIVEALGDERVNLRPNNMPNTNPCHSDALCWTHAILYRCCPGWAPVPA